MKFINSLPQNWGFFSRYANLIPTLKKVGFLSQIISGITESFVIYFLVYNRIEEIAPHLASIAATLSTIIGVLFIEVGLRKFIPYAVRCFLHRRWQGLDLVMSLFILTTCGLLLVSSGALSFAGSKEAIKAAAPVPDLVRTDSIVLAFQSEQIRTKAKYKSDSLTTANQYSSRSTSTASVYNSKLDIQQNKLDTYKRREERENKSYHSRKESIKRNILVIKSDKAEALAALETEKAKAMQLYFSAMQTDIGRATSNRDNSISSIETENTSAKNEIKKVTTKYGNALAWFTIICLVVLLLSIIIDEVYKKGSEIEQEAQPTQYYFEQGLIPTLINAVTEKLQYNIRTRIEKFAGTTPPPPKPLAPALLYDKKEFQQIAQSVELKQKELDTLYVDSLGIDDDSTHHIDDDIDDNDDEITATFPITSMNSATQGISSIIIDSTTNSSPKLIVGTESLCQYKPCSKPYIVKKYNHRFCCNRTPDSCQMKFNADKHDGKQFDKDKFKHPKNKK